MDNIEFMRAVAKDIIKIKITPSTSYKKAKKEFYEIMIKHGIKEGIRSPDGNGRTVANFEWTMCKILFDSCFNSMVAMSGLFDKDMPKELEAY